jgi:hypothetical protein
MPNRAERRHGQDPNLGKWLEVTDAEGNPFHIHLRDISGKDEFDYFQMMASTGVANPPGLCDIFLEGKVTLTNIAGLIWAYRRKNGERKLSIADVLKTVNMMTLEDMELHDPDEEGLDALPADDPNRQLAELRAKQAVEGGEAGFGDGSPRSSPGSEPATA